MKAATKVEGGTQWFKHLPFGSSPVNVGEASFQGLTFNNKTPVLQNWRFGVKVENLQLYKTKQNLT